MTYLLVFKIHWLVGTGLRDVEWHMAQFTDLFAGHSLHVDQHEDEECDEDEQADHGPDIDVLDLVCVIPD
jgi:hypothetical protein